MKMKIRTTRKRLLSVLLAVAMVLTALPLTALPAVATTSGDFYYAVLSETDKTCEITGYTGSATALEIPSELDGYTVTSIGWYAFSGCTALESITIPDSVTSIGLAAFYDTAYYNDAANWENDALYIGNHLIETKDTLSGSYTIRAGTKIIADTAFDYCTALESITIPDSVTSIGEGTFSGCTALTEIKVDTGNPNYTSESGVLFNQNKTELLCYPAGKQDRSYTIPNSVMSIGVYAFEICTALTSITIPDSVTSIGWYAFYGCTALTSITIPNSVTSIGEDAFYGCTLLTTIYGYTGSYAETYANTNGYTFVALPLGIRLGDVNSSDNKINAVDARWVLQAASGVRTFDATQTAAADVNGDGKVNSIDARWILQVASGARTL